MHKNSRQQYMYSDFDMQTETGKRRETLVFIKL